MLLPHVQCSTNIHQGDHLGFMIHTKIIHFVEDHHVTMSDNADAK